RSAVTIPIGIDGHASGVILKGIGIPGAAPGELVNGAVKAVPSTLQRNIDNPAGAAAILSVVCIGLDLEFLYRIHRRHKRDIVAASLGIIRRAIEQKLVLLLASVDAPVGNGSVIKWALISQLAVEIDARSKHRKHKWVPG